MQVQEKDKKDLELFWEAWWDTHEAMQNSDFTSENFTEMLENAALVNGIGKCVVAQCMLALKPRIAQHCKVRCNASSPCCCAAPLPDPLVICSYSHMMGPCTSASQCRTCC